MYEFTLPYPPSANRYWRNMRNREVLSAEAREYKKRAAQEARLACDHPLSGDVGLELTVYRPRKSGDLSNRIKVLEDALIGVAYHDDSQVTELYAFRRDDKLYPRVVVRVWEVNGE